MGRRIVAWVATIVLALGVAAPAFAHHDADFEDVSEQVATLSERVKKLSTKVGNLTDRARSQRERIATLESYVLDLNARICLLEAEDGGPDPGEGCPG